MPLSFPRGRTLDPDIEACKTGDRAALERVLRAHAAMLARVIGRLVRDTSEAEDVLQNTFAGAIASFAKFRGDASVATWLAQIATRQVQEHWRRKSRLPVPAEDLEAPAPGRLDDQTEARRRLARLEQHLAAIAPKKRLAFVLHVIDGLPVAEVAAMMGATEVATRSRVMWARRALAAKLRRDPMLADLVEGSS